ncbi:hypothetical protein [Paenibacillus azoreducens]|uniref:Uncharacterized protein n=1 Tax=Paenibacillus azoreducens TaxID=116718 RepID=A0A919YF34_9BACL|nr:hypothetical protein [Paenibacillus azoreducens]GIO47960.1 hypothetical protein J34TS1_27250 [Paenibacillus azoreducens]
MTPESWVRSNYYVIDDHPIMGNIIVWENQQGFYAIYTPIDKFIELFEKPMQEAIQAGTDVKQAIRDYDPENERGFNELL